MNMEISFRYAGLGLNVLKSAHSYLTLSPGSSTCSVLKSQLGGAAPSPPRSICRVSWESNLPPSPRTLFMACRCRDSWRYFFRSLGILPSASSLALACRLFRILGRRVIQQVFSALRCPEKWPQNWSGPKSYLGCPQLNWIHGLPGCKKFTGSNDQ